VGGGVVSGHRVIAAHVVCEHGAAIVDLRAGDLVFLNAAAGRILADLAAGIDTATITARIADETNTPLDVVDHDVRALVDGLTCRGLLEAPRAHAGQRTRR